MPDVVMMPMFVQWDGEVPQPEGKTEASRRVGTEDGQAGVSGSPHDGDTEGSQPAVPPQEVNSAAKKPRARRTKKSA